MLNWLHRTGRKGQPPAPLRPAPSRPARPAADRLHAVLVAAQLRADGRLALTYEGTTRRRVTVAAADGTLTEQQAADVAVCALRIAARRPPAQEVTP
jgi:hypothetical protein